jgi:hypothetical protein
MLRSVIALIAACRMLAAMGGSIVGTVVDPSGVIPAVVVTAREAGSGAAASSAVRGWRISIWRYIRASG